LHLGRTMRLTWIVCIAALAGSASLVAAAGCASFGADEPQAEAGTAEAGGSEGGASDGGDASFCTRRYGATSTLFCDDFENRSTPEGEWDALVSTMGTTLKISTAAGGSLLVASSDARAEQSGFETHLKKNFVVKTRMRFAFDMRTVRVGDSTRAVANMLVERGTSRDSYQLFVGAIDAKTTVSEQLIPRQPDGGKYPNAPVASFPPATIFHHYELEVDLRDPSSVSVSLDGADAGSKAALGTPIGGGNLTVRIGLSYAEKPRPIEVHYDNVVVETE
jgi:hypothetical protein